MTQPNSLASQLPFWSERLTLSPPAAAILNAHTCDQDATNWVVAPRPKFFTLGQRFPLLEQQARACATPLPDPTSPHFRQDTLRLAWRNSDLTRFPDSDDRFQNLLAKSNGFLPREVALSWATLRPLFVIAQYNPLLARQIIVLLKGE